MNFEEIIKNIVNSELDKRDQQSNLLPVQKFCEQHNISRTTVWRAIKSGRVHAVNIGRRVFVKIDSIK